MCMQLTVLLKYFILIYLFYLKIEFIEDSIQKYIITEWISRFDYVKNRCIKISIKNK